LVIGTFGFLVGKAAFEFMGPGISGLSKYSEKEYQRAFNLWVYYKEKGESPINSAEKRFNEKLSKFEQ
jgi:hypothetical protein